MSTTWYAKLDCNFHSNRKVRKAGRLGREVYVFMLCVNAQKGAKGEFSLDELELDHVAEQCQMSIEEAQDGIDRCAAVGLIEIVDRMVYLSGFTPEYGKYPLSNAERQERYRSKSKAPKAANDADANVSQSTESNDRNGPKVTSPLSVTDCNVGRKEGREGGSGDAPAYDPDDPIQIGNLARRTWSRLSDIRVGIARELGCPGVLPLTMITPQSSNQPGFRNLSARIRDEGVHAPAVCTRVLEVVTVQARKTRSIRWLSEALFTEGGWRTAREDVPTWRGMPGEQQDEPEHAERKQVWVDELGGEASA